MTQIQGNHKPKRAGEYKITLVDLLRTTTLKKASMRILVDKDDGRYEHTLIYDQDRPSSYALEFYRHLMESDLWVYKIEVGDMGMVVYCKK